MEIKSEVKIQLQRTQILDLYKYDEKLENARVIDGMTVQSFLYEFEGDEGGLSNCIRIVTMKIFFVLIMQNRSEEAQAILR